MGPVCAMVWEGSNAVKTGRVMLGATNPADSLPGTIRGDLCIDVGRNICHGSDSVDSANKEIALWFDEAEINNHKHHSEAFVYENMLEEAAPALPAASAAKSSGCKNLEVIVPSLCNNESFHIVLTLCVTCRTTGPF